MTQVSISALFPLQIGIASVFIETAIIWCSPVQIRSCSAKRRAVMFNNCARLAKTHPRPDKPSQPFELKELL